MASNLRRTENLQSVKARELWLRDVSGTVAAPGSLLYSGYEGRVLTHSQVYVKPTPGDLYVSRSLTTSQITLTGDCASMRGVPGEAMYSRVWMKQQPYFNTPQYENSSEQEQQFIIYYWVWQIFSIYYHYESLIVRYTKNMRNIACDSSGNTIIAYTSGGDIVISKFDSNGIFLWKYRIATQIPYILAWPTLSIGSDDSVFVGYVRSNTILTAIPFPYTGIEQPNTIYSEIKATPLLLKLSTNGAPQWNVDMSVSVVPDSIGMDVTTAVVDNTVFAAASKWFRGTGITIQRYNAVNGLPIGNPTTVSATANEITIAASKTNLYVLYADHDQITWNITELRVLQYDFNMNYTGVIFDPLASAPVTWGDQKIAGIALAIDQDGNPVSICHIIDGSDVDIIVSKMNPLDPSTPSWIRQFNTGYTLPGELTTTTSSMSSDIAIDADGRILVTYTTRVGSDIDIKIKVFDADGNELSTFLPPLANTLATESVPSINTVPGSRDIVMAYHTDGRVSGGDISGAGNGDIVVARFTPIESPIILQPAGGYVGIGTCTPTRPLHVYGQAAVGTLMANGSNVASGGYKYIEGGGAYMSWNPDFGSGMASLNCQRGLGAGGFEFTIHDNTDPTSTYITPMSIQHQSMGPLAPSNVRVGVNTKSPAYTLDVSGVIVARDANGPFGLFSSGTATFSVEQDTFGPISVPGLTTNGRVLATFQGDPNGAKTIWVEVGAGSFIIRIDVAPSSSPAPKVGWLVVAL